MKYGSPLLSGALILLSGAAAACSPPAPLRIEFEKDSANLGADTLSSLNPALTKLRLHGPRCASFAIYIYGDSEISRRLAEARADRIKKALTNFGAKPESVKTFVKVTDHDVAELYDYGGQGRLRCDPTSKNPLYRDGANCQPEYTRCYVQLEDGTICNYDAVPDPNSIRYSVTP